MINLAIILILISVLGYLSNFLNWRYLNYGIVSFLYYIGAFIHETSHAILCVLTGAKIEEFTVFSAQPHVIHQKSKIPFVGEVLISFAPIAGGMLFLFLINHYFWGNYFIISQSFNVNGWQSILNVPLLLISQINILRWQAWVMILLLFNVGAMLGPSTQDLKNIWPVFIILFFVSTPWLVAVGLFALSLIMINILLQIVVILLLGIAKVLRR